MKADQKQEYTLKITQANRTGIIVVVYEIALSYLQDAKEALRQENPEAYRLELKHASKCIEHLLSALNYEYSISLNLFRLYNYILECIRKADYTLEAKELEEPEKILQTLHDAFKEAAKQDTSAPMMTGAHEVYDGLTYNAKGRTNTSVSFRK